MTQILSQKVFRNSQKIGFFLIGWPKRMNLGNWRHWRCCPFLESSTITFRSWKTIINVQHFHRFLVFKREMCHPKMTKSRSFLANWHQRFIEWCDTFPAPKNTWRIKYPLRNKEFVIHVPRFNTYGKFYIKRSGISLHYLCPNSISFYSLT